MTFIWLQRHEHFQYNNKSGKYLANQWFLDNINLPQLTEDEVKELDKPLTQSKFHKAPQLMLNNKSPGPDGFPAEFYRHFWNVLATIFIRLSAEIKQKSTFPTEMNIAMISEILKPGRDPMSPSSYRPLSLINTDTKIISKILAPWIEKLTPLIIHSDQTEWIINNKYLTA